MERLPSNIREEILGKSITAESSETWEILKAAKTAETMYKLMDRYKRRAVHKSNTTPTTTTSATRVVTTVTPRGTGFRGRGFRGYASRGSNVVRSTPPVNNTPPAAVNSGQKMDTRQWSSDPKRTAVPTGRPNGNPLGRDMSKVECYKCHGYGHIATNCPLNEVRHAPMFADREVVNDVSDHEDGRDEDRRREEDEVYHRAMSPVDAYYEDEQGYIYQNEYEADVEHEDNDEPDETVERMASMHIPDENVEDTVYLGNMHMGPPEEETHVRFGLTRPLRKKEEIRCLSQLVTIGKLTALAMFDSGCTTESISPEYAQLASQVPGELDTPIPLQLGTAGSKSVINHGLFTNMAMPNLSVEEHYFDIINLDRYDAVIGIPAMRKYGIVLDPREDIIWIDGKAWPSLDEGEERAVIARRHSMRQSNRPMIAHRDHHQ